MGAGIEARASDAAVLVYLHWGLKRERNWGTDRLRLARVASMPAHPVVYPAHICKISSNTGTDILRIGQFCAYTLDFLSR